MNALMATALLACSSKEDGGGSAYGVVDPMPEPARCSKDATPFISGTATGAPRPDGKWDVTLNLTVSDPRFQLKALENTFDYGGDKPTATMALTPSGGTVTATVGPNSGSVHLAISVTCNAGDAGPPGPTAVPSSPQPAGTASSAAKTGRSAAGESGSFEVEVVWKVGHLKDGPYAVTIRPT